MEKSTEVSPIYAIGNFMVSALVTSFGVVLVQSPIRHVAYHYLKENALPPMKYFVEGGVLVVGARLYQGFSANMASSSVRSMYFASSKKQHAPEEVIELEVSDAVEAPHVEETPQTLLGNKFKAVKKLGQVVTLSAGDLLLTQTLDTKAQLIGLKKLDENFKIRSNLHTVPALFKNGLLSKFGAGLVNFGSLCMVEEMISKAIPIEDEKSKHFVAGALSGMTASIFSYPFNAYRDHVLMQTKVCDNKIKTPSVRDMFNHAIALKNEKGTQAMLEMALRDFKHQVPLRMVSMAATFSMVAGVNAWVGSEPIQDTEAFLEKNNFLRK